MFIMNNDKNKNDSWILRVGASAYLDGTLFFSNSRWNGLFSLDVDTLKVGYLMRFPNDYLDGTRLHKDAIEIDGKIFFLPWFFSDYMSIYDIRRHDMKTLHIPRKYYDSINGFFVKKQYLYLVPGYIEFPRIKVDTQTFEMHEIKTPKCDLEINTYRTAHIIKWDMIWYAYHRSNILTCWDNETDEFKIYNTPALNIYNIFDVGDYIWITEFGSYNIWSFDGTNFTQVYDGSLNKKCDIGNECPYGYAIKYLDSIIVAPSFGSEIMSFKDGVWNILLRDENKQYVTPFQSYLNMKIINNRLWILPYEADELIILDGKSNNMSQKYILLNSTDRKRCLETIRGEKMILTEKNGFYLNDLIELVQL